MLPRTVDVAYIVGAGFSHYAGLPLQSEFTSKLLEPRKDEHNPDYGLVAFLAGFVNEVFDHNKKASARYWPNLEDIFTCIDLAANTGHNLGFNYVPSELRTVRRALLTRTISMLHANYGSACKTDATNWNRLSNFIKKVPTDKSAFISINWDTVIEQRIKEIHGIEYFDYACRALPYDFPGKGRVIRKRDRPEREFKVIKIHGSINWLYCDSCRRLYWFPPDKNREIAAQLLSRQEWKKINPAHKSKLPWYCSRCDEVCLGTRIATFSYRKALDFPMFQNSWVSAEHLLRNAKRWVFIGYSLPAADYEFKYLLKRVQISRKKSPEIFLVTGGPNPGATYDNYQRFFGRVMNRQQGYFPRGLTQKSIKAITSIPE